MVFYSIIAMKLILPLTFMIVYFMQTFLKTLYSLVAMIWCCLLSGTAVMSLLFFRKSRIAYLSMACNICSAEPLLPSRVRIL